MMSLPEKLEICQVVDSRLPSYKLQSFWDSPSLDVKIHSFNVSSRLHVRRSSAAPETHETAVRQPSTGYRSLDMMIHTEYNADMLTNIMYTLNKLKFIIIIIISV